MIILFLDVLLNPRNISWFFLVFAILTIFCKCIHKSTEFEKKILISHWTTSHPLFAQSAYFKYCCIKSMVSLLTQYLFSKKRQCFVSEANWVHKYHWQWPQCTAKTLSVLRERGDWTYIKIKQNQNSLIVI